MRSLYRHASLTLFLATACWLPAQAAASRAAAGEVVLVTGQATASSLETIAMRPLRKGDKVHAGEVINSGANTYVNLKFSDGSFVLLRPNTRFVIEDYADATAAATSGPAAGAATPTPASETRETRRAAVAAPSGPVAASGSRAFFRLLKGGFRAVSGIIGKNDPAEYRVTTPVATIGIRGTDYLLILCDAPCANDPAMGGDMPAGSAEGGVIVGVIQGGVFVINEAGEQANVDPGQYLITLPDGTQLYLPFEPRFLRVDPIPDPATLCAE